MEAVKFVEGEKLTIVLSGRVDSSNADAIQSIIVDKIAETNCAGIIVDAKDLEYISSAGLRILLAAKKKIADFEVINVSREVYEILEITGFVDILKVTKALRKMSVDNLELIGQGTCGKVYRIDAETIVKVFKSGFNIKDIEEEKANAQKSFLNGIETAISFDMVQVGEQIGLVYELLEADTLRNCMLKNPEKLEAYIEQYAAFLKEMHDVHFEEGALSNTKAKWVGSIDYIKAFNDEEKGIVKKLFEAVPDRNTFIHGDYNVGNVMYMDSKPILIDMASVSAGHPMFDLAGVYLSFMLFPMLIPEEYCVQMTGFSKADNVLMWNKFCEVYFAVNSEDGRKEIEKILTPLAAFRVVQASMAVDAFPEEMINYCKNIVVGSSLSTQEIEKYI